MRNNNSRHFDQPRELGAHAHPSDRSFIEIADVVPRSLVEDGLDLRTHSVIDIAPIMARVFRFNEPSTHDCHPGCAEDAVEVAKRRNHPYSSA